jgi:hypothetical protein
VSLDVRIDGFDRLTKALRDAPPELRKRMRSKLFQSGDIARDEARRRIHSPKGHARRGIQTFVFEPGQRAVGMVTPTNGLRVLVRPGRGANGRAAIFAQRTRSPGRTPPPMKAARAMAKRYGLPPEAARPLALAIARRGTQGKPVMVDALRASRTRIVDRMREAEKEIVAMVAGR